MANIFDYLKWRGDLSLRVSPFNEVDNLILSQLAMFDLGGLVPASPLEGSVFLGEAMDAYFEDEKRAVRPLGAIIPVELVEMGRQVGKSPRFREMKLTGYVNSVDENSEKQFAALTVDLGDRSWYIAFRGTDDTIVGWKEDFNLAFRSPVPSQLAAVEYLERVAAQTQGRLRVGGHSKGGNLAVYAAVKCTPKTKRRIRSVYNNDGPGFSHEFLSLPEYGVMADRITTILPQSSVVGMLFENDQRYHVVKSTENGIMQHNALSWEVLGTQLVRMDALTQESRDISTLLNGWMQDLTLEDRRKLVEGVFQILLSTKATTVTELADDKAALVRAVRTADKETRRLLLHYFGILFGKGSKLVIGNLLAFVTGGNKKEEKALLAEKLKEEVEKQKQAQAQEQAQEQTHEPKTELKHVPTTASAGQGERNHTSLSPKKKPAAPLLAHEKHAHAPCHVRRNGGKRKGRLPFLNWLFCTPARKKHKHNVHTRKSVSIVSSEKTTELLEEQDHE